MEVSVVIPNHNRIDSLEMMLLALEKQTISSECYEVILVDQASDDGCRDLVKMMSLNYDIKLLEQDKKYGPSIARNSGVDLAEGSLIIFLDSDIIADPKLIESHINFHQRINQPVLACGRVLPYLPAYRTYIDFSANPEAGLDRDPRQEDYPFYWLFSNHFSVLRGTFDEIGGFDPLLAAFEDVEFGYRALLINIPIKNCSEALGYHNHPRSLLERCNQARSYNRILPDVYAKHPEMRTRIPSLSPFDPIRWRRDSFGLINKKIMTRFYSQAMIRWLLFQGCSYLNGVRVLPYLAKFLYYRLIQGYGYLGFTEGVKSAKG